MSSAWTPRSLSRSARLRITGSEIEIAAADVQCQDSVLLEMIPVIQVALAREKVHGDCVAAEGVDGEHVKIPGLLPALLALHGNAGVSQNDVHLCGTCPFDR